MDSSDMDLIAMFQDGFIEGSTIVDERFIFKCVFVPSIWDYKTDGDVVTMVIRIPDKVSERGSVKFYDYEWNAYIGSEPWIENAGFGIPKINKDSVKQLGEEVGKRCKEIILERLKVTCRDNDVIFDSKNLVSQLLSHT